MTGKRVGRYKALPTDQEIIASRQLIIDVFKSFRSELMQAYGSVVYVAKGDQSPVTELDVKVESTLKHELALRFPDFGFKGEETKAVESQNGATWYVDPIDSTMSFVRGLPYCSNMAGLVVDGVMVASVIYHFAFDELFTAMKGEGAYRNGERVFVRDMAPVDSCVFADSYSYINIYKAFIESKVKFYAPMGATGYFLTRLAQGSIQGVCYFKASIKQHDVAPGMLLALEAGAIGISLNQQKFNYDCFQFFMGTEQVCAIASKYAKQTLGVKS